MEAATPVKLITDYFSKTPTSILHSSTGENIDKVDENNQLSHVLPPTPENSPAKDFIKDPENIGKKSASSSSQSSIVFQTRSCNDTTRDNKVSKCLSLNRDSEKDKSTTIKPDDSRDSQNSTPEISQSKKTRRRRQARKKKTELELKESKPSPVPNKLLTDYFPVRRSDRRCESKIKEEKEEHLKRCILNNCEDGLQIRNIDCKGRGVVAQKAFEAGDFVVEYAGELVHLSTAKKREDYYSRDADVGCYMYYFEHKGKKYCVDATKESGRLGRLVNHSKLNGNCQTKVVEVNGIPRLILVAMKTINVKDELLYDYGDRSPESLEAHPWLKT